MAGFKIPSEGHKARELMGDFCHLVELLNPANATKLEPVWKARSKAFAMFAENKAAKRVAMVIVRADTDEKWLVTFGRKGGWRKEWNFGTGGIPVAPRYTMTVKVNPEHAAAARVAAEDHR